MTDEKPMKSAYELAMERLKKQDMNEGVERRPLSEEEKAAIAVVRSVYQARLAELEILHQGQLRSTPDPADHQRIEEDYRRERERLTSERDRKIEKVRGASSA